MHSLKQSENEAAEKSATNASKKLKLTVVNAKCFIVHMLE